MVGASSVATFFDARISSMCEVLDNELEGVITAGSILAIFSGARTARSPFTRLAVEGRWGFFG